MAKDEDAVRVRCEGVGKAFGSNVVLDSVSLEVRRGEVLCVVGSSGCGKSTLLKCIIGALDPDRGRIWICDEEVTSLADKPDELDKVRKRFGILFQTGALLGSLTVRDNIALPIRRHTELDDSTISIMVKMKLELVGLRDAEHLLPSEISGGMRKRVSLARALALDPEVHFFDEPSAGLDPITIGVIDRLILDVTKKLTTASLVVTHELPSVMRIADRVLMLHRGRVAFEGTREELKACEDPLVRQFVTGAPDGPIPLRKSKRDYAEDLLQSVEQVEGAP